MADNHGDILGMPQVIKAIQMNKKDMFEKSSEPSTLNLFAIAGDFFINPNKKGFLTNPEFSNGDVQYNFLTKMVYTAKMAAGRNNKFDAVYTPGNHCFDGGDEWLLKKFERAPLSVILTNLNKKESPIANKLIMDQAEEADVENLRKDTSFVGLSKLAIDFADGVIQGSETIHPDILQYIATKPNTPFLPYQSPETYIDEFNKFYDVVLESK